VKVTTTPKASRDLDEWIGRITENNPLAAEAFQNRIRQCIEVIRNHPEAGRRHPKRRTVRKLVEDPIVIYYEVFEDRIEILRFLAFSQESNINSLSLRRKSTC
jgi:plasmid stabilization system protein ParE